MLVILTLERIFYKNKNVIYSYIENEGRIYIIESYFLREKNKTNHSLILFIKIMYQFYKIVKYGFLFMFITCEYNYFFLKSLLNWRFYEDLLQFLRVSNSLIFKIYIKP